MHFRFTPRTLSALLARRSGLAMGRRGAWPAPELMEQLEDRQLLTTIVWDGGPGGTGTDFNTAANWVGDVLPGASDDAVINTAGPTITLGAARAVQTVTSSRALQINSG